MAKKKQPPKSKRPKKPPVAVPPSADDIPCKTDEESGETERATPKKKHGVECPICKQKAEEELLQSRCGCPFCKAKKWFKSKMFWASVLLMVCGILVILGDFPGIQDNPAILGYVNLGFGILWLVLRMVTGQPIVLTSPSQKIEMKEK